MSEYNYKYGSLRSDISTLFIELYLDPCETITCNGTNAQCQVYLDKKNMGKPFCTCPEGLKRDHNGNCGKNVEHILCIEWQYFKSIVCIILKK